MFRYLARSELLEIDADKWSKTIWNRLEALRLLTTNQVDRPHLYFFWGNNDPWVENSTRDKIITNHAWRTDGSDNDDLGAPYMQVDGSGLPHDFCIRKKQPIHRSNRTFMTDLTTETENSNRVAEKVGEFLRDVTEGL